MVTPGDAYRGYEGQAAVDGISLSVEPGKIFGIL
jgi:ABC-type multidrug transport system ATPase subunit